MKISFFDNLDVSTENIRYLLWTSSLPRTEWTQQLATWLKSADLERSQALLGGLEPVTPDERQKLQDAFESQYSEQSLQFDRLVEVEGIDILFENLRYLTDILGEVTHRQFAEAVGVGPVAVSRWRSGEQRPHKTNQIAIVSYFGLPYETNLETDALFLYPGPISDAQRRNWLRTHIERLHSSTLRQLFPALERLLKEP